MKSFVYFLHYFFIFKYVINYLINVMKINVISSSIIWKTY